MGEHEPSCVSYRNGATQKRMPKSSGNLEFYGEDRTFFPSWKDFSASFWVAIVGVSSCLIKTNQG